MDYSESLEDFKKLQESRKTAEQIERDNIDKYKRCKYCGMFYVDIDDSTRDEIMDIVKADPIFVMNIKRK